MIRLNRLLVPCYIAMFATLVCAQDTVRKQEIQQMARDSLEKLYALQPTAKGDIRRAAGYAAFSTFGVKILFAGGTTGKGVVVDNRTDAQTFMKMVQVQGGLGFGLNENRLIFVFANQQAMPDFIDQGWEFGAQANVSATAEGQGGTFSGAAVVSPGIYVYQITDTGLSATLTVAGTKFFRDPDVE